MSEEPCFRWRIHGYTVVSRGFSRPDSFVVLGPRETANYHVLISQQMEGREVGQFHGPFLALAEPEPKPHKES